MKEIIGGKPNKICPSCSVTFTFDSEDIEHDNEQYWAGLRWGWRVREFRYVRCPVCNKPIRLK